MQVLRVLRLARVFRILKLGTRTATARLVLAALAESFDVVALLTFLLALVCLLFAALVYEAEHGVWSAYDPVTAGLVRRLLLWCQRMVAGRQCMPACSTLRRSDCGRQ